MMKPVYIQKISKPGTDIRRVPMLEKDYYRMAREKEPWSGEPFGY